MFFQIELFDLILFFVSEKRLEEFKNKVKEPVGIYEALYPPIQTKQQTLKRPLDNTEKEKMLEEIGQAIEQNRV